MMEYKSLDYSNNKDGKDWSILRFGFRFNKYFTNTPNSIYLYREIVYIELDSEVSMTGLLLMPCTLKSILFFIRLFISGKTFGAYLSTMPADSIVKNRTDEVYFHNFRTRSKIILQKNECKTTGRFFIYDNMKMYVEENK